jgi:hypothetical protein
MRGENVGEMATLEASLRSRPQTALCLDESDVSGEPEKVRKQRRELRRDG